MFHGDIKHVNIRGTQGEGHIGTLIIFAPFLYILSPPSPILFLIKGKGKAIPAGEEGSISKDMKEENGTVHSRSCRQFGAASLNV